MRTSDALIEFEKPEKAPWEFKFIVYLILLIVGIYFYLTYPNLKRLYFDEMTFWDWRTYFNFLTFLYPLIGLQGYVLHKKYGWLILTHYLITATILILIIAITSLFKGQVSLKNSLIVAIILILNGGSIFIIFKRTVLQFLNITKDNKLLLILLSVIFVIVNVIVFTLS